MIALRSTNPRAYSVCEILPYVFEIEEGIVLLKDGGFLVSYQVGCPDFAALRSAQQDHLISRLVAAIGRLDEGWSFHYDFVREPSHDLEKCIFPDTVSQAIDDERVGRFNADGGGFTSETHLTLKWTPPKNLESRLVSLFLRRLEKDPDLDHRLGSFKHQLDEFEDMVSATVNIERLVPLLDDDMGLPGNGQRSMVLSHIYACLWGGHRGVLLRHWQMYADMMLSDNPIWFGTRPLMDGQHAGMLCIDGFPPTTFPGMLDNLSHLPFPFRWNTRFIMMSDAAASRVIKLQRAKWEQSGRSLIDQMFNKTPRLDARQKAANAMVNDVDEALGEQMLSDLRYGYYTCTFIVRDKDKANVDRMLREIRAATNRLGFVGRIENENAPAALMGSLPGEVSHNVRRPLLHSMHFANLIPLSSAWSGFPTNPSPLIEQGQAPSLGRVVSAGRGVFDLNIHVEDVGHTLIFGATGSGKSVLLAFLAAQFRRYKDSRVLVFDKGMSMRVLTEGVGGEWRELGFSSGRGFAPLSSLAERELPIDEADQIWAMDWVERLFVLNREGKSLSPIQKQLVRDGVRLLAQPGQDRSLLDLKVAIQDVEIQSVLEKYCGAGEYAQIFDDQEDRTTEIDNRFCCYEMDEMLSLPKQASLPLLLYLFHMVTKRATGEPAMIILDEAWALLADPAFSAQITEWLKTMRKRNVAVVMATQSLSDLLTTGMTQVLTESCPTRIFGANPEASSAAKAGYLQLGLEERDTDMISALTPKREYFMTLGTNRKVMSLDLTPTQLCWLGVSDPASIREVTSLQEEHPETWREMWQRKRCSE